MKITRKTALVKFESSYTQDCVISALEKHGYQVLTDIDAIDRVDLYWMEYELIPWQLIMSFNEPSSNRPVCNAYCIRKALIRKAQLCHTLRKWCAKRPDSLLTTHVPFTTILEIDHPEYLDEAMSDAYEVREALTQNEITDDEHEKKYFILKASMTNKGDGIWIFSTMSELQDIFDGIYQTSLGDSDDSDTDSSDTGSDNSMKALSFVKEWVVQEYISRPMLLSNHGNKKFHLRVYALACGNISVYVFDQILALFSLKSYTNTDLQDTLVHLTNTCLQVGDDNFNENESVRLFWDLIDSNGASGIECQTWVSIFEQIKSITGQVFEAASSEATMFQPLPNAFEIFGLDYLVDESGTAYFLEANAFPDFQQTGLKLNSVINRLFEETIDTAMGPQFQTQDESKAILGSGHFHPVFQKVKPQ